MARSEHWLHKRKDGAVIYHWEEDGHAFLRNPDGHNYVVTYENGEFMCHKTYCDEIEKRTGKTCPGRTSSGQKSGWMCLCDLPVDLRDAARQFLTAESQPEVAVAA